MNFSGRNIFFLTILIVGVGFIVFSFYGGDNGGNLSDNGNENTSPPPQISATFTPTSTPGSSNSDEYLKNFPDQNLVQSPVTRSLITGPATCQLEGSIVFINPSLYEVRGAKIRYQNVDDSSRLIFWKFNPEDSSLSAGPNIFANLPLPNNEATVGVTINNDKTIAKNYVLMAYITYGIKGPNDEEIIKKADCAGNINVTLP